jgi:cytochrome P450
MWLNRQIRAHFEELESKRKAVDIMDLAVQEFGRTLTIEEYAENAKLFLFAGHDTSATMISWFYYIITQHPDVLEKLKREHEQVFGPNGKDTQDIYNQIIEKPSKLSELKYTLQCFKEVLRLYPPGATGRMSQDEK